METTVLGRTGFAVSRTGFGCLPIQRIPAEDAGRMLHRALDAGITLFDTARAYSDSEAKIGASIAKRRDAFTLATKTHARTGEELEAHLAQSLSALQTDRVDVYQFHNPPFVPKPGGEDGLYDAALRAKQKGLIRAIGITQHSLALAREAVESGLYDTLQFPFNHLATDDEAALVRRSAEKGVGFICMKALSGGLITDASLPYIYIRGFSNAVPIWGFQRPEELEQLIALSDNPPEVDAVMLSRVRDDREALRGAFCRSCGYCLPCPAGIPIHNANRMTQLITRSPSAQWMTPEWQEAMGRIEKCTRCGLCASRCPYRLKPFETLPEHLKFYRALVAAAERA